MAMKGPKARQRATVSKIPAPHNHRNSGQSITLEGHLAFPSFFFPEHFSSLQRLTFRLKSPFPGPLSVMLGDARHTPETGGQRLASLDTGRG